MANKQQDAFGELVCLFIQKIYLYFQINKWVKQTSEVVIREKTYWSNTLKKKD